MINCAINIGKGGREAWKVVLVQLKSKTYSNIMNLYMNRNEGSNVCAQIPTGGKTVCLGIDTIVPVSIHHSGS